MAYLNRVGCKQQLMKVAPIINQPNYLIFVAVTICLIGMGTQYQFTYAQQQQPNANLTSTERQHLLDGISFQIKNVTFTHHTATVNGIQMHYVIGGKGEPLVLLHGYPQSWYEWRYIMPALAKNYTVVAPDLRGFGAGFFSRDRIQLGEV
jgi:dipeptidyl aminopeptidase/acylaminoacyl peptidase